MGKRKITSRKKKKKKCSERSIPPPKKKSAAATGCHPLFPTKNKPAEPPRCSYQACCCTTWPNKCYPHRRPSLHSSSIKRIQYSPTKQRRAPVYSVYTRRGGEHQHQHQHQHHYPALSQAASCHPPARGSRQHTFPGGSKEASQNGDPSTAATPRDTSAPASPALPRHSLSRTGWPWPTGSPS